MKTTINVKGFGVAHVATVDVEDEHISVHAHAILRARDDDGFATVCECGDGCEWCEPCAWDLYLTSTGSLDTWCSDAAFARPVGDIRAYHVEDDRQLTADEIRDAVATVAAAFA